MTSLRRKQIAALAVAAFVLLLAGFAGTSRAGGQSAAACTVETTKQNLNSQYGLVWAKLHPAYRKDARVLGGWWRHRSQESR